MPIITCIEDLRAMAQRRVPRMFYDYVDGGSWTESTYQANQADFSAIKLRQRVARNIERRSLSTRRLGIDMAMPLAIAPTGLAGMIHADGEILAARAATAAGIRYTLSTVSICSLEDIAQAIAAPFWFQLYVMRDREFVARLIDRAKAAGCDALVLTLDLQLSGQRHKDLKNGLSIPPRLTPSSLLNILGKPRWLKGMLGTRRHHFGNIMGHVKGVDDMQQLAEWTYQQFDPRLSWDDIQWIKERWGGTLILKGILDVEDARLALASGADALIVSNHGASAGRRALQHQHAAGDRRGGRRADRSLARQRHPQRAGRDQVPGAGSPGGHARAGASVWPGRNGRGRGGQGPGDHRQGNGPDPGAVRAHRCAAPGPRHSVAGQLPAGLGSAARGRTPP